jgi:glutamate synthase (NADPH) small chain
VLFRSITKWDTINVNPETMQSNIPDIFAGGDIVRGGATVILAMGDGRKAAAGIHNYISQLNINEEVLIIPESKKNYHD